MTPPPPHRPPFGDPPAAQRPPPPPPPGGYPVPEAFGAPARAARPRMVEISFWIWIVNLAFGGISILVALTQIDRLRSETINSAVAGNPTLDRSVIESAA